MTELFSYIQSLKIELIDDEFYENAQKNSQLIRDRKAEMNRLEDIFDIFKEDRRLSKDARKDFWSASSLCSTIWMKWSDLLYGLSGDRIVFGDVRCNTVERDINPLIDELANMHLEKHFVGSPEREKLGECLGFLIDDTIEVVGEKKEATDVFKEEIKHLNEELEHQEETHKQEVKDLLHEIEGLHDNIKYLEEMIRDS